MRYSYYIIWPAAILIAALIVRSVNAETAYDPLFVSAADLSAPLDAVVKDQKRSREIPLRVYLPAADTPAPVVLFSHGLGGTRENSAYLGQRWSARGYVAVFLQHPGSDDSVWRNKPLGQRMAAMREAAGLENFLLRTKDVPAVLDQLERWNTEEGHALSGKMDLSHVGMSGHSFGAVTTQAVSGQNYPIVGNAYTDKRIKAAIAFSPSSPRQGNAEDSFSKVAIPWMLMTGTKDDAMITGADAASRLKVFPALPAGGKYELVLDRAEHSAFTDRPLPGDREKRNPNHHRVILALSTAFWDAYLRDDAAAKSWLDDNGPQSLLEKGDRWQTK
jgi:predicted dienelactone hydrolase